MRKPDGKGHIGQLLMTPPALSTFPRTFHNCEQAMTTTRDSRTTSGTIREPTTDVLHPKRYSSIRIFSFATSPGGDCQPTNSGRQPLVVGGQWMASDRWRVAESLGVSLEEGARLSICVPLAKLTSEIQSRTEARDALVVASPSMYRRETESLPHPGPGHELPCTADQPSGGSTWTKAGTVLRRLKMVGMLFTTPPSSYVEWVQSLLQPIAFLRILKVKYVAACV